MTQWGDVSALALNLLKREPKAEQNFPLKNIATYFKMLDVFLPLSNMDCLPPQMFSFQYADSKREIEAGGSKQPRSSGHLPLMVHLTMLETS